MHSIPYSKFKHGQRVTCNFNGEEVKDAKIVKIKDTVYLYPLDIAIAWSHVDYYEEKSSIKNLKFIPRTLDDLQEGDVLTTAYGGEKVVLGICGKVYFLSSVTSKYELDDGFTLQEIKSRGFTLKQDEPANMDIRTPTEEERETINNPILSINPDATEINYKGKTYILSK